MKVVGPLGRQFDFSVPRDLKFKAILITEPQKIKFYVVRALKCYLNEKNLIHGRITATISKFSPQIFETYISVIHDQSDLARLGISLNGAHNALRSQENVPGVTMPLSV